MLHDVLESAGAGLSDRVALMLFSHDNGLVHDRTSPVIKRFLLDPVVGEGLDGVAAELGEGAVAKLNKFARENGAHELYLLTQIAGAAYPFVDLIAEISRISKTAGFDEARTAALYNRAFHAYERPPVLDYAGARKIESFVGADTLERCDFAAAVKEAVEKHTPPATVGRSPAPTEDKKRGSWGEFLSRFKRDTKSSRDKE